MDQRQLPYDEEERRRRLDALFADEPFLSPTMRARRLQEKQPAATKVAEAPAAVEKPVAETPAFVREAAPWKENIVSSPESDSPTLRLADAVTRLRSAASSDDRLRRFREEILTEWLKSAPKRES